MTKEDFVVMVGDSVASNSACVVGKVKLSKDKKEKDKIKVKKKKKKSDDLVSLSLFLTVEPSFEFVWVIK